MVKGQMGQAEATPALRNIVPQPPGPQVVGVVDQKLTPFIGDLAQGLPDSRFIWLVRNGLAVAESGTRRGWYSPEDGKGQSVWARYRLRGDEVGAVPERKWRKMGAYERNAWYWAWSNEQIGAALGKLDEKRWTLARLESLDLEAVQRFVGVEPAPLQMLHLNQGTAGSEPAKRTRQEQRGFKRQAGHMMKALYPGQGG